MEIFNNKKDMFECLNRTFKYEYCNKDFYGICNLSLHELDESFHINEKDGLDYGDYTEINLFYIYIGYFTLKYSGKYILRYFLDAINASIVEVERNYQNFDLSEEDKIEILNLAKQVKEGLPKLKIFETSTELIDLEIKEYLESQQK
jgi:hypothetical protein